MWSSSGRPAVQPSIQLSRDLAARDDDKTKAVLLVPILITAQGAAITQKNDPMYY